MKFNTIILASAFLFSSVLAAPTAEISLGSDTNATAVQSAQPINGAMSGAAASASISINNGNDANGQSSAASERIFGASVALPLAIVSAYLLAL